MHRFLYVLAALDCASYCVQLLRLPIIITLVDWGPHDNHGVAHKLYNIATVLVEVADHAFHVAIDAKSKVLIPLEAIFCTTLGEVSKTANVCEHNDRFHCLQFWKLDFVRFVFALQ